MAAYESDDEYLEYQDSTQSSAWQHPVPVFNPVLARFVPRNTLSLDSQDEPSSRPLYQQWLLTRGITAEEHRRQLEVGKGRSSVISAALSLPREVPEDSIGECMSLRGIQHDGNGEANNLEDADSESGGSDSELQMPTNGTNRVGLSPGPFSSNHSPQLLPIYLIERCPWMSSN